MPRNSKPGQLTRVRTARTHVLAGLVLTLGLCAAAVEAPDAEYLRSFEKWKAELVEDLKQNWLVLAGLFWLKPGANTFGRSDDNAIVLPAGPPHAGVFRLEGDLVRIELEPGVEATIDGQKKSSAKLQSDLSGQPTIVALGRLRMHLIQRGTRLGIRLKDVNSQAVQKYGGPIFFPLDMSYRVKARFLPAQAGKTIDVPNVLGDTTPTPIAGEVHFEMQGQELTLTALGGEPGKGLSFVFADRTSKGETYPGGRFLDTGLVANGMVELDFNRAYNPPCAVTPYATCPLAPRENRLPVEIRAGEKYHRTPGHP